MSCILMGDISIYQKLTTLNFNELRDKGNILAWSVKSSMGYGKDLQCARRMLELAQIVRVARALYHWADPNATGPSGTFANQANYFLWSIATYKPHFVSIDSEQYWQWALDGSADKTKIITPDKILLATVKLYDFVLKVILARLILEYTGRWFCIGYCPQLGPWIGAKPSWIADYYDGLIKDAEGRRSAYTVDWDDLQAIAEECKRAGITQRPTNVTNALWRQISSRMVLPGVNANIDLSVWLGTDAEYYEWLGWQQPSIVTPVSWQVLDPSVKDDIAYQLALEHSKVLV